MPNEYVAACITGTIECAVPGKNPYACDGGNPTRFFDYHMDSSMWNGSTISPDGLEHGLCGNTATISFDGDTGSGFERINGEIQRNPIAKKLPLEATCAPEGVFELQIK